MTYLSNLSAPGNADSVFTWSPSRIDSCHMVELEVSLWDPGLVGTLAVPVGRQKMVHQCQVHGHSNRSFPLWLLLYLAASVSGHVYTTPSSDGLTEHNEKADRPALLPILPGRGEKTAQLWRPLWK
ncbi:hypothetical protein Bbelb_145290, partial [Branchiostoma belcheri]